MSVLSLKNPGFVKIFRDKIHISSLKHTFSDEFFSVANAHFIIAKGMVFMFLATNFSFVTKDPGYVKIFREEIHISSLNHTFSDDL